MEREQPDLRLRSDGSFLLRGLYRGRKPRRHCRPASIIVESLEQRLLLAGNVRASVQRGDLLLRGDRWANSVEISPGSSPTELIVTGMPVGGSPTKINGRDSMTLQNVTGDLRIRLGAGADVLIVTGVEMPDDLRIRTGAGPDEVSVTGGSAMDNARIRARRGADHVCLQSVTSQNLRVGLGRGNDRTDVSGASVPDRAYFAGRSGVDMFAHDETNSFTDLTTVGFEENGTSLACAGEGNPQPPTLNDLGNRTVEEQNLLSFVVTANDPDSPPEELRFSLDPGSPSTAQLDPASGLFSWTPDESHGPGSYSFTARATDAEGLSDSAMFAVTVSEVNRPPVLSAIGDRTIDENPGAPALTFTASATDPDDPPNDLRFSLDAGAPAGAQIDPVTGTFIWTPDESQGPGSFPITVRVRDNGSAAAEDFETITITVNEVNRPPVLAAIGDKMVDEGQQVNFTAAASDPDLPANALTFSLDPGAPAGAAIPGVSFSSAQVAGFGLPFRKATGQNASLVSPSYHSGKRTCPWLSTPGRHVTISPRIPSSD